MAGFYEELPNATVAGYLKGASNPYQDLQRQRQHMVSVAAQWGDVAARTNSDEMRTYAQKMANAATRGAGANIGQNGNVVSYTGIDNPNYNRQYLAQRSQQQMEQDMRRDPGYAMTQMNGREYVDALAKRGAWPAQQVLIQRIAPVHRYNQLLTTIDQAQQAAGPLYELNKDQLGNSIPGSYTLTGPQNDAKRAKIKATFDRYMPQLQAVRDRYLIDKTNNNGGFWSTVGPTMDAENEQLGNNAAFSNGYNQWGLGRDNK